MRHLRSAYRAIAGVGFLLGTLFVLLPLQAAVMGPIFKNDELFPRLVCKGVRRLFGLHIEFNQASAPIETKRRTWYVANHMSPADPFVLAKVLKGSFVAAGWLTQIGIVNAIGKAGKVLFVSQKKDERFKKQDRGKIVRAFNEGKNVIMFPEGWTNDGATVELFRAGLTAPLYGGEATDMKGRVLTLQNDDIVLQPIAIRVKSVDGRDAFADPSLREAYSMHATKDTLRRIWERLGYGNITLELTVFPPLNPKDFPDGKALMNEAHRQIVGIVAPDQKTVEKAPIEATQGERKTSRPLDP